jgi:hypothetical protein
MAMTPTYISFVIVSAWVLITAVYVVTTPNIVRAAYVLLAALLLRLKSQPGGIHGDNALCGKAHDEYDAKDFFVSIAVKHWISSFSMMLKFTPKNFKSPIRSSKIANSSSSLWQKSIEISSILF